MYAIGRRSTENAQLLLKRAKSESARGYSGLHDDHHILVVDINPNSLNVTEAAQGARAPLPGPLARRLSADGRRKHACRCQRAVVLVGFAATAFAVCRALVPS